MLNRQRVYDSCRFSGAENKTSPAWTGLVMFFLISVKMQRNRAQRQNPSGKQLPGLADR